MGLNHQMASLSCALGEAFRLGRTLLLPAQICLFALHTERWSDGGGPGQRCVPITDLFDLNRLSHLVPVTISANDSTRLFRPAHTARVGAGWSSKRVELEHPCVAGGARLVRRHVDTFWFQQCARRHTDYNALAARLNLLVGAAPNAPKPLNIILRSGLCTGSSCWDSMGRNTWGLGGKRFLRWRLFCLRGDHRPGAGEGVSGALLKIRRKRDGFHVV